MYKVGILNPSGIPNIYILFAGIKADTPVINTSPYFPDEFDTHERELITENNIPVILSGLQLYADESVMMMKRKILTAVLNDGNSVEFSDELNNTWFDGILEEFEQEGVASMYLFGSIMSSFALLPIYRAITNHESESIDSQKVAQLVSNYNMCIPVKYDSVVCDSVLPKLNIQTHLSYEDIRDIDWFATDAPRPKWVTLGQKFIRPLGTSSESDNSALFAVNPMSIVSDDVYNVSQGMVLTSMEHEFVFNCTDGEEIMYRTVYLCTPDTVVARNTERRRPSSSLALYFPDFANNIDGIKRGQQEKIPKGEIGVHNLISFMSTISTNQNVQPYLPLVKVESSGVRQFNITIHPKQSGKSTQVFPLETIFKNVHATKQIPCVLFNPGLRRDKLYRIYFETAAQNGNKIPFVKESVLLDLKKRSLKSANISFFVWLANSDLPIPPNFVTADFIQVTLYATGVMVVQSGDMTSLVNDTQFTDWFCQKIRPVIHQLNDFLGQSGFAIREITRLTDTNVEINTLTFGMNTTTETTVRINDFMPMMNPFLYSEARDAPPEYAAQQEEQLNPKFNINGLQEIYRRYKRVEYFKRIDAHDEFLSGILAVTQDKNTIRTGLMTQFPSLSAADAQNIMVRYQNEHRTMVIPGKFSNKKIRVLENSGFKMHLIKKPFSNLWAVTVTGINSFSYLSHIRHYLYAFFLVTQHGAPVKGQPKGAQILPLSLRPMLTMPEINELPMNLNKHTLIPALFTTTDKTDKEHTPVSAEPTPVTSQVEAELAAADKDANESEFAFFEEYEDEDDEEGTPDTISGGAGKKDPNKMISEYFWNRIREREPLLQGTNYTRACQASAKRQPIILTESEKDAIDKKYTKGTKPYTHALKYGHTKNNESLYYICPRYWCVKPNMEGPLTEADVNAKKCGEIITDRKNIKEGQYTYAMGTNTEPGFVSGEQCYPCCFDKWNTDTRKNLLSKCNPTDYPPTALQIAKKKTDTVDLTVQYTHQPLMNTTPLPRGRLGF